MPASLTALIASLRSSVRSRLDLQAKVLANHVSQIASIDFSTVPTAA